MRWRRPVLALCGLLLLGGCRQDMEDQPRLKTFGATLAFEDRAAVRPLPEGVVARDWVSRQEAETPPPVDAGLLARGRERFNIFCSPCHGGAGYGDGLIVERGFPAPPSFHSQALRQASARHIYDVIAHGHGVMYSYADRVRPHDRWAIIAYIRALQLSQRADFDRASEAREGRP